MIAHRTGVLRAAGFAILMAMTGCRAVLPGGGKRIIRSDSQQRVGILTLQIVDCASGQVLSQGTREVLARDVAITQRKGLGRVCFDKRIDLDHGFYIQMAECGEPTREEISGFGLTSGRVGYRSSWEWFDVDRESHAVKRQELGEMKFTPVALGARWEVGRTEVAKEISFRVFGFDPTAVLRNAPRWRIQVKEGSYIDWPSAANGGVVLHSFHDPSRPLNLLGRNAESLFLDWY